MITPAALALVRAAAREAHNLAIDYPEDVADHITDALDAAGWDIRPADDATDTTETP